MLKAFVFDYNKKTGEVRLTRAVDLSLYLKSNYNERKLAGRGFSKKGNFRKIGSIPVDVLMKYGIDIHDDNEIRKFLREHPEYRTSEGAI